jgi:hypothetical protein
MSDNGKLVIEMSFTDMGHISLALDDYVRTVGTSQYEAKPLQERFDQLYRAVWELERAGVKRFTAPTKPL